MARKRFSNFLLGLFVTGGFFIFAVILIWVGSGLFLEKGKKYVTYFNESVQGLDKNSEVKFRGVAVGRVIEIFIAPDNRHVGVLMLLDLNFDPVKETIAQLQMAGITGVMFVILNPREDQAGFTPEKIDFISEYPVIPSQPSDIRRILTGIEEVIANLKEIDTKGLSAEAKNTLQEMQNFFGGAKTKRILSQLEGTSSNMKQISIKINKDIAKGELNRILLEARGTFEGARTLVENAKKDLSSMQLADTVGKSRVVMGQINTLIANLEQTSNTLNLLVERLYNRPSDVLFGKPPQKRWNE